MGKVLIDGDTLFMRTLLKNTIFPGGHAIVHGAADGDEAAAQFRGLTSDLVTTDMVMPRIHGTEVLKETKAFDPMQWSPCVPRWDRSRW